MLYIKRLITIFHHPSQSLQEISEHPCFFLTSLVIILCSIGYVIIAELGLFNSLMLHFIAAYALMVTIIWLLPTVITLLLFKLIKKKFSIEAYMEASALSIFSVVTIGFIFLSLFIIYSNFFAEPKRTAYFAMFYYNQWYPLAIIGGIGLILLLHRIILIGRNIVKIKLYQILLIWLFAAAISIYVAYLFFRGWL